MLMRTPDIFTAAQPAVARSAQPVCTVVIDAEEDFDWEAPVAGTAYSTACMRGVLQLRDVLGAYGAVPTYLMTYPILDDPEIVRLVRRQLEKQQCEVGIQLHPWVTPPYGGGRTALASYSGNIGAELEERKLVTLIQKFVECFGFGPKVFRAGRYGLGQLSSGLLEKHGLDIDTSIAPRTSFAAEGGPDYSGYDYRLFWFGQYRRLLELPLCRSIVGWGGPNAHRIYQSIPNPRTSLPLALLSRSRCAERITLSPEGNDIGAMGRLVRGLRAHGQSIVALSFHSSSLQAGRNPYVQTRAELHGFYDRLSAVLTLLATDLGFGFATATAIPGHLKQPTMPGGAA